MSDDSLPASNNQYKHLHILDENLTMAEVYGPMRVGEPWPLPPQPVKAPQPPAKPRRRREERKSGLWAIVHAAQQHGLTHPKDGFWTMLPKEYDAILALEHKAVAQVVLHVLRQTIGRVGDGPDGRREWARISQRDFARAGLMDYKNAGLGIREALAKHYILRRPLGARRYEYAIRWQGTN